MAKQLNSNTELSDSALQTLKSSEKDRLRKERSAKKGLSSEARAERRKQRLSLELNIPGFSDEILSFLNDCPRPLGRRVWNCFMKIVSAPHTGAPRKDDPRKGARRKGSPHNGDVSYYEGIIDLAEALINEIQSVDPKSGKFKVLQSLARNRETWPVLIANRTKDVELIKDYIKSIGLNSTSGIKRARRDPNTPVILFAERLVVNLKKVLKQHELSLKKRYSRAKWEYFYLVDEPPPLTQAFSESWRKIAGSILDFYHGTKKARDDARREYFQARARNPIIHPIYHQPGLSDVCRSNILTAQRQNEREARADYLSIQLQKLKEKDWEIEERLGGPSSPPNKASMSTLWEPPPCILGYPSFRSLVSAYAEHGSTSAKVGAIHGSTKVRGRNHLKSAKAVYGQIKPEILDAVIARLPQ